MNSEQAVRIAMLKGNQSLDFAFDIKSLLLLINCGGL